MSKEKQIEHEYKSQSCFHAGVCPEYHPETYSCMHHVDKADVAPRAEWISVEERLPERMKPVLVLATGRYEEDGYDVLIAYHDGGEWEEQCVHSHECCVFYIYADVKFWMPLPEPPKGGHHE
jgi:hypothetical protein